MEKIIKAAVERGASDLHIKAGDVFRARINGRLVPLTKQRLTPDQTRAIAHKLIPSEEDRAHLERMRDFDCSWGMPGVGRFRVNVLRQRSSFMIVMRVIPFAVPSIESLGLPDVISTLADSERGLLLVAGVSGSGKTSTVAAIIEHINRTKQKHVVTIENPIEFLHRDINCSVTQREVGVDTESMAVGLRAALRQDPDVILIGEMRDPDTADIAVKAAETGHLVISVMPTPDVPDVHRADGRDVPAGRARHRAGAPVGGAARHRGAAAPAAGRRGGAGGRHRGAGGHAAGAGLHQEPDAAGASSGRSWPTAATSTGCRPSSRASRTW